MKKLLLVIAMLAVLLMTGCNKDNTTQNNETQNNQDNQQQIDNTNSSNEIGEMTTIEIKGVNYKDINTIPTITTSFDNSLVYTTSVKDGNDIYVKMSDGFVIEDAKQPYISAYNTIGGNTSNQRIILPSKIYSSEEGANYLYNYNGETYYIPVEKCALGDERIVYRDYGIELIKENDGIKINGILSSDVIGGWDLRDTSTYNGELRYDDVSLCEAYMESWKISDRILNEYSEVSLQEYISSRGTNIFQVDFDDDPNTLEFIYESGTKDYVHIDSSYPTYSLITYSEKNGIRNYNDYKLEMLAFHNILNYKNVFYGYGAFELNNKIDFTIGTKERVITGYYIYDKDAGLVYVNRFANGRKLDEDGFKELSKVALTMDEQHTIKENENGEKRIDAFSMYDREYLYDEDGNIVTNEDGSYKENPNSKHIEAGTKIYINYINEDGYSLKFKTEDGTEYTINYYYT